MKVKNGSYVSIDYTLTLDSGEVVDQSQPGEPLGYLHGMGQVIPGLESAIDGKEVGESVEFTVEPEDAYGIPDERLFRELARESFPNELELEPGMMFQATGPNGPMSFRIKEVLGETVLVDFNHPLAGERLHFKVVVSEVRDPTPEETAVALAQSAGCQSGDCEECEDC